MVGTFNKTGRDGFTCIDSAFASKKKSCDFDLRPVYSCYFDDLCLS